MNPVLRQMASALLLLGAASLAGVTHAKEGVAGLGVDVVSSQTLLEIESRDAGDDISSAERLIRTAQMNNQVTPAHEADQLTSDEMLAFQRMLNDAGYDVGKPDGVAGPRTGRAIAKFLTDQGLDPYEVSLRAAYDMALNKAGNAPNTATDADPSDTQTTDVANGLDASAFAGFSGIPLASNRLAVYDMTAQMTLGIYNSKNPSHVGSWQTFVQMAWLGVVPSILDNDEIALKYAALTLSEADRLRLLGGESSERQPDEFHRREVIARLRAEYIGTILAKTPRIPLSIVEVRTAHLGEYNFDAGRFEIGLLDRSDKPRQSLSNFLSNKGLDGLNVAVDDGLKSLPNVLQVEASDAKRLLQKLAARKGRHLADSPRRVFMAIFSDIAAVSATRTERGDAQLDIDVKPSRIALFSDVQLKEMIAEFPLDPHRVDPPPPVDPAIEEAKAILAINASPNHILALETEKFAASKGFLDAFVQSAREIGQANEFAREDRINEIRSAVTSQQASDSIWLTGEIGLGEYDPALGSFVAKTIGVASGGSDIAIFDADLHHNIFNLSDIASIPVERELARKAVDMVSDRTFTIRARVTPVGAVMDRDRSRPHVTFEHRLAEIYILASGPSVPPTLIAHLVFNDDDKKSISSDGEIVNAELPERPILSQDLLVTLGMRDRLDQLSERSMAWLLANRWLNDNAVATSLPARFFDNTKPAPTLATVEHFSGPFREWVKALPVEMPDRVTISWRRDSGMDESLPQECHHMSSRPIVEMFADGMTTKPFGEIDQQQVNDLIRHAGSEPIFQNDVYLRFRKNSAIECADNDNRRYVQANLTTDLGEWWPKAIVVLDRLPIPAYDQLGNYAEIDVSIKELKLIENGNDVPHIRLDVDFEEVRFLDVPRQNPDGSQQAQLLAKFSAADIDQYNALVESIGADYDVLGVRIGQSFEEADRALRSHFDTPHLFETTGVNSSLETFQNSSIYLRQDGREYVAIFYEPARDGKKVTAVLRQFIAPLTSFTKVDLISSLRAKYGNEALDEPHNGELIWGKAVTRPTGSGGVEKTDCRVDFGSGNSPNVWLKDSAEADVGSFMPWEEVRDYGFISWPRLDRPGDAKYSGCGVYLNVWHTARSQHGVRVFLADIEKYNEALANAKTVMREMLEGGSPTSDVKL